MYDLSTKWFDSATVRSSDPHDAFKEPDGKWFSPDLVPITKHKTIKSGWSSCREGTPWTSSLSLL